MITVPRIISLGLLIYFWVQSTLKIGEQSSCETVQARDVFWLMLTLICIWYLGYTTGRDDEKGKL